MGEIKKWLQGFVGSVAATTVPAAPNACGLYPAGLQQLSRRTDVLGNRTVRWRQVYLLRRNALRNEDAAQWLHDFQQWVAQESESGNSPFDAVRAEKGRLLRADQTGTATYEVQLVCEFTTYHKGE